MEEVKEQKFQCKFCSKRCFSGKSLGGHMRGHLALISAARREKVKSDIQMECDDGDNDRGGSGLEENFMNSFKISAEQSNRSLIAMKDENRSAFGLDQDQDQVQEIYGVRRNTKKSWKACDLKNYNGSRKGNICTECCKRFPSSRALAGHMRTHSVKSKDRHLCEKCGKAFDSMRAMYGHMKSHSKRPRNSFESSDGCSDFDIVYPRKKRSMTRYKLGQNSSLSTAMILDDVEHAAMGLMMLSMGVRNWDGFNGPVEKVGNGQSEVAGDGFVCDLNELDRTEKQLEELHSRFSGSGNSSSKQNESEINDVGSEFESVSNSKAELQESIDERPCSDTCKKPRAVDVSGGKLDGPRIKMACESARVELQNDGILAIGMDQRDLQSSDSNPCKQMKFDARDPELEGISADVAVAHCDDSVSEVVKDFEKKREYKCNNCNKIFGSHQALGGHRNRYKILGNCCAPSMETGSSSEYKFNGTSPDARSREMAMPMGHLESSKIKEYECTICFKVFSTGQALGGHKRAHYSGFPDSRIKETTVVNQELHNIQNTCGLNVPVIAHQGARDDVGFNSWWIGSNHVTDPLLISN